MTPHFYDEIRWQIVQGMFGAKTKKILREDICKIKFQDSLSEFSAVRKHI